MDREIIFEKVYSKTRKLNSRYTSSIVSPSTRVKSLSMQNIQAYICHKSERVF